MTTSSSRKHAGVARHLMPQALVGDAAVQLFRDEAQGVAEDQVEVLGAEPAVVVSNVRVGVASVQPRLAELVEARPKTRVDWILSLPNLSRAVEHAAAVTTTAPVVTRAHIDARYAELQRYRGPALLQAQVFASPLFHAFDAKKVADTVAGSGMYNHAQDGVVLASMFREHHEAIAGKHPFTDAHITAMEQVGAWIMENVTPSGAKVPRRATATMRDRLWTLLRRRHAELRKAGIELFGEDDVDGYVPKLGARVVETAVANDDGEDSGSANGGQ